MKVSIVIPCFNEKGTIKAVLEAVSNVQLPIEKEIVVIDDFSTDGTREYLTSTYNEDENVKIFYHSRNIGKGPL